MHPMVVYGLAQERSKELRREAEQARLARLIPDAPPGPARHRVRIALGDRLVRIGMRLAGPEKVRTVALRYYVE